MRYRKGFSTFFLPVILFFIFSPLVYGTFVSSVEILDERTIQVNFSDMVMLGADDPLNYSISGTGQGTFSFNPSMVVPQGNFVQLSWNCPEMMLGGGGT